MGCVKSVEVWHLWAMQTVCITRVEVGNREFSCIFRGTLTPRVCTLNWFIDEGIYIRLTALLRDGSADVCKQIRNTKISPKYLF